MAYILVCNREALADVVCASSGDEGARFINRIESDILLKPFCKAFRNITDLSEHASRSAGYDEFRESNPEVALEGMQFLTDFARRERRLREKVNVTNRLSKWKKPRIASDLEKQRGPSRQSTSDSDQAYEHPSLGTLLPIPQDLGKSSDLIALLYKGDDLLLEMQGTRKKR
uniref:Uncharacterized protein n=1 Tax=Kwoniella bestiolae CBS 10118 TaxID=1296100 RepID=A0A1B9GD86_9TREE|nr:hypothetical protein I302_00481 [Kwoniella bestiolae CBS 10118]OCF28990.1 hypothetical protein I302_00481 [Kwoniella bestiolae CBS 10118]